MQNLHYQRTLIHQSPQPVTARKLKLSFLPENVKLRNINVQKSIRSRSFPSSLNLFTKIAQFKYFKSSTIITQLSIGSQKNIKKNQSTLTSQKEIVKQQQPSTEQFKQRRRSCECTLCGQMSQFQKQSRNHEYKIQQIEKERESPMHKFSRQIRKHQIYLMAPYLFAKEISTEPPDSPFVRQNTLRLASPTTQLLDVIKQEDGGLLQSSKILDRTPSKKLSFFESFIEKQKEIINSEKSKLKNKQFSSLSYHLLSRKTYKGIKPIRILPQIHPFNKQEQPLFTERDSTKKSEHQIKELYITPFISKYRNTKFRLATMPDVYQHQVV